MGLRVTKGAAAVVVGWLLARTVPSLLWDGEPLPLVWVVSATFVCGVLLWRNVLPPKPFSVWALVQVVLTLLASVAVGSSWAALTWLPAIAATLMLARWSSWVLVGLAGTIVLRDAPALVVLSAAAVARGSFQYFLALAAAMLAPLALAWMLRSQLQTARERLQFVALSIVASGLVWTVLASAARAAYVGLAVGLLVGTLAVIWRGRITMPLRRVVLATLAIAALLVPIDAAMSHAFGDGQGVAFRAVSDRLAHTVTEIERDGTGSIAVRIALWRQAGIAMLERPWGHGPASYGHVIHAYQAQPLLWSGSPHSVWALAAVETGVLGVLALGWLVIGGAVRAFLRGSATVGALLAATAVMSLDIFASMPANSLVWWGAVGAAWGPAGGAPRGRTSLLARISRWGGGGLLVLLAPVALALSVQLARPCEEGCDPIERYGGNPDLVGAPTSVVEGGPEDPRWSAWMSKYPLAYWLRAAHAREVDRSRTSTEGAWSLLRDYPYQSAERYVDVAASTQDISLAREVAECGLARFFDGRPVWRGRRVSVEELDAASRRLEALAEGAETSEEACRRAGLPALPIGLRSPVVP